MGKTKANLMKRRKKKWLKKPKKSFFFSKTKTYQTIFRPFHFQGTLHSIFILAVDADIYVSNVRGSSNYFSATGIMIRTITIHYYIYLLFKLYSQFLPLCKAFLKILL